MTTKTMMVVWVMLMGLTTASGTLVTIDFNSLAEQGIQPNMYFGSVYIEDGFKLTTSAQFAYTSLYDSPMVLYSGPENGTISMTREDGEAFDLLSIDFASGLDQTVTIIGTKSDSSSIDQEIILDDTWLINSYPVNDFSDILSVTWVSNLDIVFDNITMIPEPSAIVLLGLGGWAMRIKRNNATL